jgi:predicted ATP-grasp superfamily ATP-dependent carboligase
VPIVAATAVPERQRHASGSVSRPGGAVVVGGDYRALGVVRSLGRRGIPVYVFRQGDDKLAALSRYARCCLPWPRGGDATQVAHLLEASEREPIAGWALIPSSDETAALVARHFGALGERFTLTTPPWEILRLAHDKRETYALADRVGVDRPWTLRPRSAAELTHAPIEFPVILKPAVKESFNRLTAAKAWRVGGRHELLRLYEEACRLVPAETVMVQELVPGCGEAQFSYAALCDDGRPLASLVARRARQHPAELGRASTFVETIACQEVVEPSLRILEAMRLTGLVEVEFKRDPRDGRLKLLDVNPRVWGWHTVGAAAGVDFSHLLWLFACGEPVPRLEGRPGVRWVRASTDLPTVATELLHRRLSLREYLRSLEGPRTRAIFAADDPVPGLAELPIIVSILLRRFARGGGV